MRVMETFTIGQVAERSGFTASALRFYEAQGLIEPVDRTPGGYRIYDERSLARLRFVARAKQLGCSLEEITELAGLWEGEDCGPVQLRLHELVTAKIADAQQRSAELIRLTAQLQTAAAHLGGPAIDGPCDDQCACVDRDQGGRESVPVVLGERDGPAVACTLPADQVPGRTQGWQRLLEHATGRAPLPDGAGVRVVFDPAVPLDELSRLALAEQGCCAFFAFAITVDDRGVALEVRAPTEAADVVTAVFGAPG